MALLLGLKGPSSGAATTALIYLIAFPFLLLPLVPGRQITILCHSFLIGFGAILAPALWLYTTFMLVFSFNRSLWILYGTMAAATTVAVVVAIIGLKKLPARKSAMLLSGVVVGLFYFPVAWALAGQREDYRAYAPTLKGAQVLYNPVGCALKYHQSHADWPASLRQAAGVPGCQGVDHDIDYQRTSNGFTMQTTGRGPLYYADESGIVRINGSSGIIVDTGGKIVGVIVFRLQQYKEKEHQYPPSLSAIPDLDSFLQGQHAGLLWSIDYDRDSRDTFRLTLRPKQYGVTGLRSYYVNQTGVVHATSLDRVATLEDPLVSEKEMRGF